LVKDANFFHFYLQKREEIHHNALQRTRRGEAQREEKESTQRKDFLGKKEERITLPSQKSNSRTYGKFFVFLFFFFFVFFVTFVPLWLILS
jgi:quinol-cytochrome oxidoreductase complex cytochrome b subunit